MPATPTAEISTLSLHDALPISCSSPTTAERVLHLRPCSIAQSTSFSLFRSMKITRSGSTPKRLRPGGKRFLLLLIQRQNPPLHIKDAKIPEINPLVAAASEGLGLMNSCTVPRGNCPDGNALSMGPRPKDIAEAFARDGVKPSSSIIFSLS